MLVRFEHVWYNLNMDKSTCFTAPKDVTHGRGYVYSLQYHIVWCTKYRKRVLTSGLDEEVKAHLRITAEDLQAKILACYGSHAGSYSFASGLQATVQAL